MRRGTNTPRFGVSRRTTTTARAGAWRTSGRSSRTTHTRGGRRRSCSPTASAARRSCWALGVPHRARRRAGDHRAVLARLLGDGERRGLPDLECPPRYEMNVPGGAALRRHDDGPAPRLPPRRRATSRAVAGARAVAQIIQGTRSLLTLIPATGANSHARAHGEHRQVGLGRAGAAQRAPGRAVGGGRHRRVAGWCVALSVALEAHLRGGHEGLLLDVADHATRRSAVEADSRALAARARARSDAGAARARPRRSRRTRRCGGCSRRPSCGTSRHSKHAPLYALCRLRVAVDACVRASTRRHSDGLERNLFDITEGFLGAITGYTRRAPC